MEAKLTQVTKAMKGWAIKLLPSVSGLPDRLVLLPGGRVIFVELKSPTRPSYTTDFEPSGSRSTSYPHSRWWSSGPPI